MTVRSEHLGELLNNRKSSLLEDVRVASLLLFVGSLLIRLPGLQRLPWTDEMYTVLAARGWLSDGVPRIADGVYDRAEWFTVVVAWFFNVFGDSLIVARLPSLLVGSLLVVAVFLWTRWTAGNLAAWIAAAFMAFSPLAIQMSQFARFYALFGLLFWMGAVGTYMLVEQRFATGWRAAIAIGVLGCFLVSLHLQVLMLIGLAAIGFWLAICKAPAWIAAHRERPVVWIALAALGLGALAGALVLIESGLAERLLERYRSVPLHAVEHKNQVWFYHIQFIERYPTLWPVLPFLAMLAVAVRPLPSLFCACVFGFVFVVLSFGGMKHFQYMYFILPFLFALWGISLAAVLPALARWVSATADRFARGFAPNIRGRSLQRCVIGVALLFLIFANGAPARTLLKPLGINLQDDAVLVDWTEAKSILGPRLNDASVVLSPADVQTLYYLDRLDVVVNASRPTEYDGTELSHDPRTGKLVISTPDSLNLIIDCFPSGLFLADPVTWRASWALPRDTAIVVETRMTAIELPPNMKMLAFSWQHPETHIPPAECTTLPDSIVDTASWEGSNPASSDRE